MSTPQTRPLVAVDVGNTRMKFGLFDPASLTGAGVPEPVRTLGLAADEPLDELSAWLAPHPPASLAWWIGTVNLITSTRLIAWLRDNDAAGRVTMLSAPDLPLEVRLPRPDMVGIDRLLAAVTANRLRDPKRPAVIVDLGTAIKVDLVAADGAFLGGAIMPGIGLSARALHEFTDLLPLIDMDELADAPPALGDSTIAAMQSGLFWGAVGGAKEIIARLAKQTGAQPQVVLSGGAAAHVAGLLAADAIHSPHLVLSGIALAAGKQ